jgi:flagellar basal-body rod protein FlgB
MSSIVSQPVFGALSQALDVAALKQAVHTANIANAGVPGYHRLEVSFDAQMQRASDEMTRATDQPTTAAEGGESWPSGGGPRVVRAADETVRLDKEMALMAKDAVRYQTLLSAFERTVGLLQMAIKEGREG